MNCVILESEFDQGLQSALKPQVMQWLKKWQCLSRILSRSSCDVVECKNFWGEQAFRCELWVLLRGESHMGSAAFVPWMYFVLTSVSCSCCWAAGCGKVVRGTWETKLSSLMLEMPGQNAQSFWCENCQLSCSLRPHSNSVPKCAPRFPSLDLDSV